MVVGFMEKRSEPVELPLLRATAHQGRHFSDVSMAVGGPDHRACLDEGGDASRTSIGTEDPERNQSRPERQGIDDTGHHTEQARMIGGVEPGYRMMALGGRQLGCKSISQAMNAVLQRGLKHP